jgi:preprotein translocase subunit YajC
MVAVIKHAAGPSWSHLREATVIVSLILQNGSSPSPLVGFLPLLLIFAIFYFLLFLPMQRQRKAQQKMLRELKNGDTVVTNGGLIGTITTINDDDTLILRVKPDNTRILVARSSVASLVQPDSGK